MPTTYSPTLGFALMATGEDAGTWGNIANTNLAPLIESAICGRSNPNFLSDADLTITIANGADSTGRYFTLNCTSAVPLTATRNLICPLNAGKTYIVINNTTGGQSIVVKGSSGTGATIPNGLSSIVTTDGVNYNVAVDYLFGLTIGSNGLAIGSGGMTCTGGAVFNSPISISVNSNAGSESHFINSNSGSSTYASAVVSNGTGQGALTHFGTGYTPGTVIQPSRTVLSGQDTNGLALWGYNGVTIWNGASPSAPQATFNNTGTIQFGGAITAFAYGANQGSFTCTGFGVQANLDITGSINTTSGNGMQMVCVSNGVVLNNGASSWAAISDIRLKTEIRDVVGGMAKIDQLRPITYIRTTDAPDAKRKVGLIAQDVQKVLPEAVYQNKNGFLELSLEETVPLLICALQEAGRRIRDLEARL